MNKIFASALMAVAMLGSVSEAPNGRQYRK